MFVIKNKEKHLNSTLQSYYTYSIHHSTGTACVYAKIDENDDQVVFNLTVLPKKDGSKKEIKLHIGDIEIIRKRLGLFFRPLTISDVYDEFDKWYDGSR